MELPAGNEVQHAIGLVAALVLGALIGLERQLRQHPAGFGLLMWAVLITVLVVLANVVLHVLGRRIGA